MFIESLRFRDWRNIPQASIEGCGQFVVLHGKNGMGKSNILEALYVMSTLKSFREHISSNFIRWQALSAMVEGNIRTQYGQRKLTWTLSKKGRGLQIDGLKCTKLNKWFSLIRAILFCPGTISIVREGPDVRRKFLDRARFTANPSYLPLVRNYMRVLEQKKALLKSKSVCLDQLNVWNEQLINLGVRVASQRQMILKELMQPFQEMHSAIAGSEEVSLELTGLCAQNPEDLRPYFTHHLKQRLNDEIRLRRCLVGPHTDDLKILINGKLARKFASQGQVRSIVLALKLAEVEAARMRGDTPLFLIDDLSSELDRERTHKLLSLLAQRENQIWITTTDPNYLGSVPFSKRTRFYIENGTIKNM